MKPANQSDKLTEFYRAWLEWAEGGENVHGFHRYMGLCTAARLFGGIEIGRELQKNLMIRSKEIPDIFYPFDKTSTEFYMCEDKRTNPKRLQWCRDHI